MEPIAPDTSQKLPESQNKIETISGSIPGVGLTESAPRIPVRQDFHGTVLTDFYRWLEDVHSAESLSFVALHNRRTLSQFGGPVLEELKSDLLKRSFEEPHRLPGFGDDVVVDFKTSPDQPKGVLRVCSRSRYLEDPINAPFENVLDIDALSKAEGVSWVYSGTTHRGEISGQMIIKLSPGGTDSAVFREFDLHKKEFIKDGFSFRGKGSATYFEEGEKILFTIPGSPEEASESGYALEVKLWDRSGPVEQSRLVYRAPEDHMAVHSFSIEIEKGKYRSVIYDAKDFWSGRYLVISSDGNSVVPLPLPEETENLDFNYGTIYFSPQEEFVIDGLDYCGGVVLFDLKLFLEKGEAGFKGLFRPTEQQSIESVEMMGDSLYLSVSENVTSRLLRFRNVSKKGTPEPEEIKLPGLGAITSLYEVEGLGLITGYEDFITPKSYHILKGDECALPGPFLREVARFDASNVNVSQHWAVSADGTRVPFFVLDGRQDKTSPAPAIVYGYGGFKYSETPEYRWKKYGLWLERGGVYAIANIRGGYEFGPEWHKAGTGPGRERVYEDFAAVARRLVDLGYTRHETLGASGASNGGLLMGNMLVKYPGLFGAIDCGVPLLDMLRYHELLAGDSWVGEYGKSSEKEDFQWLKRISPYHNIRADIAYPPILISTATSDDRVHPCHARKMAAELLHQGHDKTYFYEETETGHSNADHLNWINEAAIRWSFMVSTLFGQKLINQSQACQKVTGSGLT